MHSNESRTTGAPTASYILKTETDGTIPTRIFSMVLLDVDTGTLYEYASDPKYPPIAVGLARLALADTVISHTQYHRNVVRTLGSVDIPDSRFLDTFSACRGLFDDIAQADGRGHGLSAWAHRLDVARGRDGKHLFWTQQIQDCCRRDAMLVRTLVRCIERELATLGAIA